MPAYNCDECPHQTGTFKEACPLCESGYAIARFSELRDEDKPYTMKNVDDVTAARKRIEEAQTRIGRQNVLIIAENIPCPEIRRRIIQFLKPVE